MMSKTMTEKELPNGMTEIDLLRSAVCKSTAIMESIDIGSGEFSDLICKRIKGNERLAPKCSNCFGSGSAFYGETHSEHGDLYSTCKDCKGSGYGEYVFCKHIAADKFDESGPWKVSVEGTTLQLQGEQYSKFFKEEEPNAELMFMPSEFRISPGRKVRVTIEVLE